MSKYFAEFPLKYGDIVRRHYTSFSIAKREVVKHVNAFQGMMFDRGYGVVYTYNEDYTRKEILFEYER